MSDITHALGAIVAGLCTIAPPEDVREAIIKMGEMAKDETKWRAMGLVLAWGQSEGETVAANMLKIAKGDPT